MSRSDNTLCLPPSLCCPPACPIPCPVICCTPPVSFPCMPRVPRVQCKTVYRPQPAFKPTKAVVYLPPCPSYPRSYPPPRMEVTYLPAPPPSSCFYVCAPNCEPCTTPCPPTVSRSSPCTPLCLPCPLC